MNMTTMGSGNAADDPAGAKVRVLPLDVEVDVHPGETLFAAGARMGLRWPSICGGEGVCTTCFVRIEEGAEGASPREAYEAERLASSGRRSPEFRLACQMRVIGPMTVYQRGVKWPGPRT